MADNTSVDLARVPGDNPVAASPDLLRAMVQTFAGALMGADADAICGARYGQRSAERVNYRNGYRQRRWDTWAGTIDLAIPKLRQGSYFPGWLLERRRRAEQALISVVATSYLLGVPARRVEKLAETLGITSLSKSQVSELAKSLDASVEQFRSRPLGAGPYRFVQAGAMTVRVREGGRTVLVHALIATGVNADGHREIPGLEVTSSEDGAGWLAFFRGLVARGLSGVVPVTSEATPAWSPPSPPRCQARAGSGAGPITPTWGLCRPGGACHRADQRLTSATDHHGAVSYTKITDATRSAAAC
jgi:putative transposase